MGQKKRVSYGTYQIDFDVLSCLVLSTLIGDSQNQSYLYLGTLIPFKLKVRSYISSMYFSWKYGLRMGQHGFRKMSFQTLKT
jgi:hypothetical protein